jgi:5'(3')-deoxyribonucleotidase
MVGDLFERLGGLKREDFPTWDIFDQLPDSKKRHAYSILSKQSFWANLPLVDGALKAVKHLKDFGHEVVWVTAPWKSCRGWETARRAWIKHHFGNDNVIVTSKKGEVPMGEGDIFIDDKPDNIDEVRKAHPSVRCFIFDTAHNKKYTDAPRFSWADVGELT